MPFSTTKLAAAICDAIFGLASNVWGSVLGSDSIDVTRTYFPPIWAITSAYSFSTPIAWITLGEAAEALRWPSMVRPSMENRPRVILLPTDEAGLKAWFTRVSRWRKINDMLYHLSCQGVPRPSSEKGL